MKRRMRLGKVCCCLISGALALLPAVTARATDEVMTPPYYDTITVTQGTLNTEAKVYIRKGPDKDYGRVGKLRPGDVFTVLGQEDGWYQIEFEGVTGYVLADLVEVNTFQDQVEHIDESSFEATITEADYPVVLERRGSYSLRGSIECTLPITAVRVKVYNQLTLEEELSAEETFARDKGIKTYDLFELDEYVKFRKLTSGEKRLVVTVESGSVSADVLDVRFYVTGNSDEEALHITADCEITIAHDKVRYLTDGEYDSGWTPESDTDELTLELPKGKTGGIISLEWTNGIDNYTIECYDSTGVLTETIEATYPYTRYVTGHTLSDNVAKIVLTTNNLNTDLAELRVYDAENISTLVPRWQDSNKKVDMMVIAAHQGDELLYFGSLIPSQIAADKNVEVIYMSENGRVLQAESMKAMWAAGLTNAPVYLDFEEKRTDTYEEAVAEWDLETAVEALVERIRATQPDVIVTHNVEGEDGNHQHSYTATLVRRAVLLAADETSYPDSYAKYGAWEVKKLYVHQYEANTIELSWDQPLEAFGMLTAEQVTELAFSKYASLDNHSVTRMNEEFEANRYGLIFSNVGEDVQKNDLFENIQ